MKTAKRIGILVIIFTMLSATFFQTAVSAAYKVPFEVFSDAAYLTDMDTGAVLYEKNADKKVYPASLTKIMTAIIAIEHVKDLEGTVVTAPSYIFDEFVGINVSNADIQHRENVRMLDLLYALILPSGCEAGSIIADHVGNGEIQTFVDMMNAKAKELGALNTNFMNAHGLYDPEQVTTVRDMTIITKYALTFPIFEKICNTVTYDMPATNEHAAPYRITHTNYMLSKERGGSYYYEGMKGVKTGSIDEVGKNLVSTASKNGYNYMLVTIGAPFNDPVTGFRWPNGENKSYDDATALYDWAFASFTQQKIMKENDVVDEIPVSMSKDQDHITLVAAGDVTALLPNNVQTTAIQKTRTLAKDVVAPVKKGTVLGYVELKLSDEIIASVDLVASSDIERNELLYIANTAGEFLSKPLVITLLVILILLIFIYIAFSLKYRQLKRRYDARARKRML